MNTARSTDRCFCCGRKQAQKERRLRLGVQRIEDTHHPGGYRELTLLPFLLDFASLRPINGLHFRCDSWEHELVVEKVLVPEPGQPYPVCLDGQRQGSPEDCGGIGGFYHLLEAVRDPLHKDHEELREWLGGDFDPDAFSVDAVNRRLLHMQRRRSKTATKTKPSLQ